MPLVLVPLVGPFHLRFPRYDVVTVRDTVARLAPAALATTALHDDAELGDPSWQELEEPALTMELVPWAKRHGVPVVPCGAPVPDPEAASTFDRVVGDTAPGRATLQELEPLRDAVRAALAGTLDLNGIRETLVPAIDAYRRARHEAFGPGPGTEWIEERAETMADRLEDLVRRSEGGTASAVVVAAVPVDHLPELRRRLAQRDGLLAPDPDAAPPSAASRARALRDAALTGTYDDPAAVLRALQDQQGPEAAWVRAEVLLRHGHPAEALETLREASRDDFTHPPQLPGWLLARLGQLYDLDGDRDAARRAYRGALALAWAPAAAREAAHEGLARPFRLPAVDEGGPEVHSGDAPGRAD